MRTRAFVSRITLQAGLGVTAAALVALSCGGGAGPESLTGPAATATGQAAEKETGLVSTSAAPQRVAVCHFDAVTGLYSELAVPPKAVAPHLGHGDFEKIPDRDCADGPVPPCPCFSAESIDLGVGQCPGQAGCVTGSGFRFTWWCSNETVVAVAASDYSGYSCYSLETGTVALSSEEEFHACLAEMGASQAINTHCDTPPAG